MIMFDEVPKDPLAFALKAERPANCTSVERPPKKSMDSQKEKLGRGRKCGEESRKNGVDDDEKQREVSSPATKDTRLSMRRRKGKNQRT
jgi:hypothetical protein